MVDSRIIIVSLCAREQEWQVNHIIIAYADRLGVSEGSILFRSERARDDRSTIFLVEIPCDSQRNVSVCNLLFTQSDHRSQRNVLREELLSS